jgi:hypothetical protein
VTTIELDRVNLAERLVRLTGGGTWAETVIREPALDGEVFGQDTAHAVPWRGGLFWLCGDTTIPSYPLGNFHTTGALAPLDPTPEDGVDLGYYLDGSGYPRGIAPTFPEGPVWLSGLVALDDDELWATFVNVASDFTPLHEGMVRWSDAREAFDEAVEHDDAVVVKPQGPAIRFDGPGGDWVMYRGMQRVRADRDALADPSTYQAYTPLVPNGSGGYTVATTPDGVPDWQWRTGAPVPALGDTGTPTPWEAVDPDTGEVVAIHNGTIAWDPWRGRWLHVFTQSFGASSLIGEIWYAEGDTPVGPWSWARKVITHDGYSFYNPYFHPWFAERGGRRVLFEGTYTAWLGSQPPTPRHDYNQFLYALDLDDAPVAVPVPLYDSDVGPVSRHDASEDAPVAFGALELPGVDEIAVRWTGPACDPDRRLDPAGAGEVAFYARPAGTAGPGLADLVEWTRADGSRTWSTGDVPGATPGDAVAAVWAARWAPPVPLSLYPQPDRADAGPVRGDLAGRARRLRVAARGRDHVLDLVLGRGRRGRRAGLPRAPARAARRDVDGLGAGRGRGGHRRDRRRRARRAGDVDRGLGTAARSAAAGPGRLRVRVDLRRRVARAGAGARRDPAAEVAACSTRSASRRWPGPSRARSPLSGWSSGRRWRAPAWGSGGGPGCRTWRRRCPTGWRSRSRRRTASTSCGCTRSFGRPGSSRAARRTSAPPPTPSPRRSRRTPA